MESDEFGPGRDDGRLCAGPELVPASGAWGSGMWVREVMQMSLSLKQTPSWRVLLLVGPACLLVLSAPGCGLAELFEPPKPGGLGGRITEAEGQAVTVALHDFAGELIGTVVADEQTGAYRFDDLAAGQYRVSVRSDETGGPPAEATIEVRRNQRTETNWTFQPEVLGAGGELKPATFVPGEPAFVELTE